MNARLLCNEITTGLFPSPVASPVASATAVGFLCPHIKHLAECSTSSLFTPPAPPLLSIIKTRRSGGLNVTLAFKGDLLVSVYSWTLLQQCDSQSLFNTLGGFTLSCLIFSSIVSFT